MRIEMIAFTKKGCERARKIAGVLQREGDDVRVCVPERLAATLGLPAFDTLAAWTAHSFAVADALVFVSACGIAVRAVAPHVRDKLSDPAVVCVDEAGNAAVSLLSGHVGGANRLARRVALACGGQAIVSTATDVRQVFAVDLWASEHDMALLDRERIKDVSAALLEGEQVGFASEVPVLGTLPQGLVTDASARLGISVSLDDHTHPFAQTLRLVPRTVTVGIGCRRGVTCARIAEAVDDCLREAHLAHEAVSAVASIDIKRDEPGLVAFARERGWNLRLHSADELAGVPGTFASSAFVLQAVGVDNVCERAACACGETLLLPKHAVDGVTVALALRDVTLSFEEVPTDDAATAPSAAGRLVCVGLGPGAGSDLTYRARAALDEAEVIVGYTTYLKLIKDDYPDKELLATPMRGEVDRCRMALERAAAGSSVAMVCSGDPGVYGMAGLLFELAVDYPTVEVEVVPGVSAANGGAAVLGAPLMHDWCSISLSDLMTPWETIARRLEAAAQADFCISLYNPASHGRKDHLRRACDLLLNYRAAATPCGLVRAIGREGQESRTLTLAELRNAEVDMLTCVFVGNSQTRIIKGHLVTPRGYLQSKLAREVLVFGGTSEGRELVEWLDARGTCRIVACTATSYGADLLAGGARVTTVEGPLDGPAKQRLVETHDFCCIVDATHPYAEHISQSVRALGESSSLEVVRVVRGGNREGTWTSVCDAYAAARHLAQTTGPILLTTGSKDLATFVNGIPDATQRLYVRVLPLTSSIERACELGLPASHVIAMQGPFSERLNEALIRDLDIAHLVTKQSGNAGGFDEKLAAAQACGVELVVIERPHEESGLTLAATKTYLEERYGL